MPEFKVQYEQVIRDEVIILASDEFDAEEILLNRFKEEGIEDPSDLFVYNIEEVKNT